MVPRRGRVTGVVTPAAPVAVWYPINATRLTIHALYHGPPHQRRLNQVYVASPTIVSTAGTAAAGLNAIISTALAVNPTRLTRATSRRCSVPRTSGR